MISFVSRILDLVSPRTCVECRRRLTEGEQVLCASCNLHLPRTHYEDDAYDNEMAQLFWARIPIERAAALFFYQAQSEASRMIYALKYGDHSEIGEQLGCLTAEEFQAKGFFKGIDCIVPVPLTKSRERQRGYNQSLEIAKGVSQVCGMPIMKHALKRVKFKDSQTHKNRLARTENVEDAFQLAENAGLVGKHVLLIDDIVTTGATICACGKALQRDGRVHVSVLSLGWAKG